MSASKLKNIALLILLLTNLVLLGQVVIGETRSAQYRESALSNTIAILAESGITLARESIPQEPLPAPAELVRDRAAEGTFAAALLGAGTVEAPGTGAASAGYSSPGGTVRFSADGTVDAVLAPAAHPLGQSTPEAHAAALLRRLGMDCEVLTVQTDGADTVVTARQRQKGYPIFSCELRLTYRGGALAALSGRRLSGTPAAATGAELSAATLLLRFRNAIRERGDVCSQIQSIQPGYELTATFSGLNRLVPVLHLTIDGGRAYYLNIETGELRPA